MTNNVFWSKAPLCACLFFTHLLIGVTIFLLSALNWPIKLSKENSLVIIKNLLVLQIVPLMQTSYNIELLFSSIAYISLSLVVSLSSTFIFLSKTLLLWTVCPSTYDNLLYMKAWDIENKHFQVQKIHCELTTIPVR